MSNKTFTHEDHQVVAVYEDDAATVFRLRHDATLAELCEMLVVYGRLPQHVEVNVGR
jgi:hypothetical protein